MSTNAERLATLVQELRGTLSQGEFAKRLGVNRSTVTLWESGLACPGSKNLQKLALLKGWSFEQMQSYLEEGQLSESDELEQILNKVRSLSSNAVAQVAAVAVETLAARTCL